MIGGVFTGMGVYRITTVGWKLSLKRYLWMPRDTGRPYDEDTANTAEDSGESVQQLTTN